MTELQAFFQVGFQHIIAVAGIDHILFVVALCALYDYTHFRKLLILITAFTFGHSLTLALASVGGLDFNPKTIEVIIPITIFLTALYNFFEKVNEHINENIDKSTNENTIFSFAWGRYSLAFFFGTIHGLAFSNFLRMAFQNPRTGVQESILLKLLAFNVGLEVGQILVILGLLGLKILYDVVFDFVIKNKTQRNIFWRHTLSSIVLVWALWLLYRQIFS